MADEFRDDLQTYHDAMAMQVKAMQMTRRPRYAITLSDLEKMLANAWGAVDADRNERAHAWAKRKGLLDERPIKTTTKTFDR